MFLTTAIAAEAHRKDSTADKETETVNTVESWDDSDCDSEASFESIDLLELEDPDDEPYFWYNDEEDDCPDLQKNGCIQRAMSGFTVMLNALLVNKSASTRQPIGLVLTDSVIMEDFHLR